MRGFRRILCVLHRIVDTDPAFEQAVLLAELNQASLAVAIVIPSLALDTRDKNGSLHPDSLVDSQQQLLESLIAPYRGRVDVECKVIVGIGFLEIVREVLRNDRDLVVKSIVPPTWLNRLLTGDDVHLLRECPCPVWLLHPHGTRTFKRVLAAVDVDKWYPLRELTTRERLNEDVIEMAASLALQQSAEMHIAYAWQSYLEMAQGMTFSSGISPDKWAADMQEEKREQRRLLRESIEKIGMKRPAVREALDYLNPSIHLLDGPASQEIPASANTLSIECIVMGTVARTGIRGFLMGNTAEEILEQVACSVLAIKPQGFISSVELSD